MHALQDGIFEHWLHRSVGHFQGFCIVLQCTASGPSQSGANKKRKQVPDFTQDWIVVRVVHVEQGAVKYRILRLPELIMM